MILCEKEKLQGALAVKRLIGAGNQSHVNRPIDPL
jgi:hypothetical protein